MKRRDLVKQGLAAAAAAALPLAGTACAPAAASTGRQFSPGGRARNIIFYAYDGLTVEDMATARYFAERHLSGRVLTLERLLARGASGLMLSHSLTSVVTDSASATTAWATGRKIVNGALSMFPDGRELTTILDLAKQTGKATGLITSTRITHATPAGWIAKVPIRGMEDEIASRYLEFQPEVLLGGGIVHFHPEVRADGRDLYQEFRNRGYAVAGTAEDMARANASRLLGTFAPSHMPFEVDRRFQGAAGPSLAEMVEKGLNILADYGNGFVVQVEAGRIDHANHGNDPGAMVWDMIAADDALDVILRFVDRNPDTLLIMASDHGTGSGAVYGVGRNYNASTPAFDHLGDWRASYERLYELIGSAPGAGDIAEAAREHLGVRLSSDQARLAMEVIYRERDLGHPTAHRSQPANGLYHVLSSADFLSPDRVNLNYATGQHTAGPVPVAALGADTTTRGLGVVDNTELFGWMTSALGIEHDNPIMTEREALRYGVAEADERPHWA